MYYQCNLNVKKNMALFGKYCGSLAVRMDSRPAAPQQARQKASGAWRVRLKVMHTNSEMLQITPGVQGLPCLLTPTQGKPCTPASLLIAAGLAGALTAAPFLL